MTLLLFLAFALCTPLNANPTANNAPILKVGVYDMAPLASQKGDSTYHGLMIEIWEEIADQLKYQYIYENTDMDGLMEGLENGTYDVGLGAISITPNRALRVDFTQPVNPSGTGIAVARNSFRNNFRMYWRPILISLAELIGGLLLLLLLAGTIVWWAERKQTNVEPEKRLSNIEDGLWWAAVTMTTVGYGDKVPRSRLGRSLAIVWIFLSIILISLFTANASAIFSREKVVVPINSRADLQNVRVGAASFSSGEEYLKRENINYQSYNTIEAAIDALLNEEVDAVVYNIPVLKYLNNNHPTYLRKIAIAPNPLLRNNMGIALQKSSPLHEPIDQVLLKIIAESDWQDRVYSYFGEM